jgi:hypothetical protein
MVMPQKPAPRKRPQMGQLPEITHPTIHRLQPLQKLTSPEFGQVNPLISKI